LLSQNRNTEFSQKSFILNDRIVDPVKGLIWIDGQSQSIEPKVMSVLVVLASKPKELFEQEELFSLVWPNSIFSPGSLRRCIAAIRKVVDVSNAESSVVVTHPKRGYSLDVIPVEIINKKFPRRFYKTVLLIITLLIFTLAVITNVNFNSSLIKITEMEPITVSEHEEFNAKFSSTGKYIAYIRQLESGYYNREIWIKNRESDQDIKLVAAKGSIDDFSWDPTSDRVLFAITQGSKEIWQVVDIKNNDTSQFVHEINDGRRIGSIQWGLNGNIYYLLKKKKYTQLISFNTITKSEQVLSTFDYEFMPYRLSLSIKGNQLAIAGFNKKAITVIKQFKITKGEIKHLITLNENWYFLAWHPSKNELLLSDGRELSIVTANGNLVPINFENFDFIRYPQFDPNGKGILLSQGKFDIDVSTMELGLSKQQHKIINTNTVDRAASLSPDGSSLAFISHRKGFPQLYLFDIKDKKIRLIYHNHKKLLGISPPIWHPTKMIIASANYDSPFTITLNNDSISIEEINQPVGAPIAWNLQGSSILVKKILNNEVYNFSLKSKSLTEKINLTKGTPLLGINGEMLILKNNLLMKINKTGKSTLVFSFEGKVINVIQQQQQLYIAMKNEKKNVLWHFELKNSALKELGELPENIDRISAVQSNVVTFETSQYAKDIIYLHTN